MVREIEIEMEIGMHTMINIIMMGRVILLVFMLIVC